MATPTTLPSTFTAGQVLTAAQMNNLRGAFRILQVVSTVKSDAFSSTSTTLTDITGLSVSITPSATSNKVLVFYSVAGSIETLDRIAMFSLLRGSTEINIGDAAGSRSRASFSWTVPNAVGNDALAFTHANAFLDSPATTSATTYKIQGRINVAGTFTVNRQGFDSNAATIPRFVSSITAFEVSA